jgi:hypothetical protein
VRLLQAALQLLQLVEGCSVHPPQPQLPPQRRPRRLPAVASLVRARLQPLPLPVADFLARRARPPRPPLRAACSAASARSPTRPQPLPPAHPLVEVCLVIPAHPHRRPRGCLVRRPLVVRPLHLLRLRLQAAGCLALSLQTLLQNQLDRVGLDGSTARQDLTVLVLVFGTPATTPATGAS